MTDLIRVRSKQGKRGEFLISRGLFEKHPDDYVAVEKKTAAKKTDTPVKTAE